MNQINAITLQNMFLGGAKRIEANKEYINELNVFPVPDGDTGTNMSMTIMSAAKEVGALDSAELTNLVESGFTLRDVFGYDIPESARAAKAMMDSFGISGEEAMNLIAAGETAIRMALRRP